MQLVPAIVAVAFVPIMDWVMMIGLANRMGWAVDVSDYTYWPLSFIRWLSVCLLAFATFVVVAFGNPRSQEPAAWALPTIGAAFGFWVIVALLDLRNRHDPWAGKVCVPARRISYSFPNRCSKPSKSPRAR